MYAIFRFFLFQFDPEKVHYFTASLLRVLLSIPLVNTIWKKKYCLQHQSLEREVFGIRFPNPVGLAAGFDKNAAMCDDLASCGFGFIEIGTVTPKPQNGNPKPRLFRLPKDKAIVNRMGFNNDGVIKVKENLLHRKGNIIIGGNIGKNKDTPNENALNDYLIAFEELFEAVDYFVVNVSSPNTPNLRQLQDKEPLTHLLTELMKLNTSKAHPKPILLKIAPDLENEQLDDIIDIVHSTKIQGVVATNTTISRENLKSPQDEITAIGAGGLSGVPVKKRSTEVIRYLHEHSGGTFPIIGVGGIHSADDALEKLSAGASLVQLYTGFVYEGPGLIKKINKALLNKKD